MEENISPNEAPGEAATALEAELNELRAWKASHEAADALRGKREAIAQHLAAAGAVPEAVPLMVLTVGAEDTRDAAEAAQAIRERYPSFFPREQTLPTAPILSPQGGPAMDGAGLAAMSAEDINRRWEEVKMALRTL